MEGNYLDSEIWASYTVLRRSTIATEMDYLRRGVRVLKLQRITNEQIRWEEWKMAPEATQMGAIRTEGLKNRITFNIQPREVEIRNGQMADSCIVLVYTNQLKF